MIDLPQLFLSAEIAYGHRERTVDGPRKRGVLAATHSRYVSPLSFHVLVSHSLAIVLNLSGVRSRPLACINPLSPFMALNRLNCDNGEFQVNAGALECF